MQRMNAMNAKNGGRELFATFQQRNDPGPGV